MATQIPLTKKTPRNPVTIAKQEVSLPSPYTEGHQLRAVEADALNNQYHSQIRNTIGNTVKEMAEAGKPAEEIQAEVDKFVAEFDFGQTGTRSRNPVETQAMEIARALVKDALQKAGHNLSEVSGKAISQKAREVLAHPEKGEKIRARARQIVEERQNLNVEIDI